MPLVVRTLRLHFLCLPSSGDLPNPGIKSRSPVLQADSLLSEPSGKIPVSLQVNLISLKKLPGGDQGSPVPGFQSLLMKSCELATRLKKVGHFVGYKCQDGYITGCHSLVSQLIFCSDSGLTAGYFSSWLSCVLSTQGEDGTGWVRWSAGAALTEYQGVGGLQSRH